MLAVANEWDKPLVVSKVERASNGISVHWQRTRWTVDPLPCFSYTVDSWIRAMYVRRTRVCEEGRIDV
jgi:hypothetical protein